MAVLVGLMVSGPADRAGAMERILVAAQAPGRMTCGEVAAGWQRLPFDDRQWSALGDRQSSGSGDGVDAGVASCRGAAFIRYHFDGGAERAQWATATLHIAYTHGFAAYLNGVEVARRGLAPGAPIDALALEPHGLEAERLFLANAPALLQAGDNVLAVEVHPFKLGQTPTWQLDLTGADRARLVRGPYLQRLGSNEITIIFETDLATQATLCYGPTERYGQQLVDASTQRHHSFTLHGLQPGTNYHYRVAASGRCGSAAASSAKVALDPIGDGQRVSPVG